MFEDLAALIVLPFIGLGFASSYVWFMMHPIRSETDLAPVAVAWRRVAELLGGTVRDRSVSTPLPTLSATVNGLSVEVEARAWREWAYARNVVEYSNQYQTVITAEAKTPRDFKLIVSIEERDVPWRGSDFETRFRVTSPNSDLAKAWVSDAFKSHALLTSGYIYTLEDGCVAAVREGLEHDSAQLMASMQALAALATRGEELLGSWRRAADMIGGDLWSADEVWEPDGKTVIDTARHGSPITIDATRYGPAPGDMPTRLSTRIRAKVSRERDFSFALHGMTTPRFARYFPRVEEFDHELSERYILRSTEPDRAARRFAPDLCRTVIELSPRQICRDKRWVTVSLKGLVVDQRQLSQAVHIAAELARSIDKGPYR